MGSCCSTEEDSQPQHETREDAPLLSNPVANNTPVEQIPHGDYGTRHSNSLPKKSDEQSALTRILNETASNFIDVAALDSHTTEHHDYQDRSRHYQQEIYRGVQEHGLGLKYSRLQPSTVKMVDIESVEQMLTHPPIMEADLRLIKGFANRASRAVKEIRVEHREDLVVPFGTS